MNFIKRLLFAIKSAFTSTLVGVLSSLVSVFYFFVAFDLFWNGNAAWTTPLRTILFHAPLIIEVVVIVLVFVHSFTKKKLEQQQAKALNAENAQEKNEAEKTEDAANTDVEQHDEKVNDK